MIGQVVGRWTVLSRAAPEKRRKQVRWLCRCACGTESLVQHAVRTQPKSVFELADYLP